MAFPKGFDPMKFQEAMQKTQEMLEKLGLLFEVLPEFEIKRIKLQGKSYIAILFERFDEESSTVEKVKE